MANNEMTPLVKSIWDLKRDERVAINSLDGEMVGGTYRDSSGWFVYDADATVEADGPEDAISQVLDILDDVMPPEYWDKFPKGVYTSRGEYVKWCVEPYNG